MAKLLAYPFLLFFYIGYKIRLLLSRLRESLTHHVYLKMTDFRNRMTATADPTMLSAIMAEFMRFVERNLPIITRKYISEYHIIAELYAEKRKSHSQSGSQVP